MLNHLCNLPWHCGWGDNFHPRPAPPNSSTIYKVIISLKGIGFQWAPQKGDMQRSYQHSHLSLAESMRPLEPWNMTPKLCQLSSNAILGVAADPFVYEPLGIHNQKASPASVKFALMVVSIWSMFDLVPKHRWHRWICRGAPPTAVTVTTRRLSF